MPEYLSPGVYVEEVDTGIKPIEGVSTSTAGFVGVTQRGPVDGPPELVTSMPDFRRRYGGYLSAAWGDSRFLAHAIQGFFENGGQRAFIKRVPGTGALAGGADIPDGIVTRLTADTTPLSARLESLLGVSAPQGGAVGTALTFSETVGGIAFTNAVVVATADPATNMVTWAGALPHTYSREGTAVTVRAPGAATLRLEARNPGAWGDNIRVRFDATSPARSQAASRVSIPADPITAAPAFAAAGPAAAALTVNLNAGHGLVSGDTVEFTQGATREQRQVTVAGNTINWTAPLAGNFAGAGSTIRLLTAARAGLTAALNIPAAAAASLSPGDQLILSGGGLQETVIITGAWGGASPVTLTGNVANTYVQGAALTLSTVAARVGADRIRVTSGRTFYPGALVELDNTLRREYFLVDSVAGNDIVLTGNTVFAYAVGNTVRLIEYRLRVRHLNEPERIDEQETHEGLSMNPAVASKYFVNVLQRSSNLISASDLPGAAVPFHSPATPTGTWMNLSGGDDGTAPADLAFAGVDNGPNLRTGIEALTDIDDISIVAVPGKTSQVIQNALITHCEMLRYRFAVLDPPVNSTIQGVQNHRNLYDTKYAALYYTWLRIVDPLSQTAIDAPPSGHMAGIYARTDVERGVHKAPANEVVRGILAFEKLVNKREQDILNPSPVNINVLRDFRPDGRGLRIWGARCITSDTSWKYINVRRLFIFIEKSLDQGTQWVVFEPNDDRLWARVRQSIEQFLLRVWRDGALMGRKAEEAFYVKADRTTMTQDDIDNGRLIIQVGIAPVKPAEFVIIRIGQWTGGSEVEEL